MGVGNTVVSGVLAWVTGCPCCVWVIWATDTATGARNDGTGGGELVSWVPLLLLGLLGLQVPPCDLGD